MYDFFSLGGWVSACVVFFFENARASKSSMISYRESTLLLIISDDCWQLFYDDAQSWSRRTVRYIRKRLPFLLIRIHDSKNKCWDHFWELVPFCSTYPSKNLVSRNLRGWVKSFVLWRGTSIALTIINRGSIDLLHRQKASAAVTMCLNASK